MSKVTAPLLSFTAAGQIAKTQVYASWKGRPYVRRYVIPSNPQSAEQTLTRDTFAFLNNVWRYMPAGALDAWQAYATNNRFTPANGFIKQNLAALRSESTLDNIILSPSANGGLPAASMTLTPGNDQITVDLVAPTLPSGWTIESAHALAIRQQDPQSGTFYPMTYGADTTSTYQIILTGLTDAVEYVVGGWFSYTVSPTKTAYGISLIDTATTT